jgi:UDPglucose 6-dehydrogenase
MNVGIVGLGFVGNALSNGLKESINLIKIDPKLNTSIDDLIDFDPEIVFVCVPTPMKDSGEQDISIVNEVLKDITEKKSDILIVLKSTVLPNYANHLTNQYKTLVFNPEFLRENYADEDFINSKMIVLGGNIENTRKVSDFYKKYTKCITQDHIFTDEVSASLIKYAINSFLALKVVFFNEMNNIFEKSESNNKWDEFVSYLSRDPRIGSSHMNVPGPDGRYGFGGACFPKDTNALISYSKKIDAEFKLLKKAININNNIRDKYNVTKREKEQNIIFISDDDISKE